MQQGMLLHTLLAPEAAEYFKQLSCVLEAELNVSAFKLAWQQAVDRHAVLRTAFVWEGVKDPIQVVHQRTTLLWEQHDWRDLSAPQQQQRLKAFLETDRERGFHLSKAPLMRCALIQKDSGVYQFVWSCRFFSRKFLPFTKLSAEVRNFTSINPDHIATT